MAQPEKRENSVLFSLRELRQIEENRVQEEEAAVRSAEQARLHAQQQEERRQRDEQEAKINAERAAALAIETARENAEREARMRVESAEAAERNRQQAALEQQRLQQEMELRRAEVAKKRPTWMLAVTGFAIVGVVVAIVLIINAKGSEETAKSEATEAKQREAEAVKAAEKAQELVDKLKRDLDEMDKKVSGAVDAVVAAQNDADRATAKANLDRMRQQKADYERRLAEAKAQAERAKRLKGATVSEECKNNPLAKGCM
jgi:colicin import membrane protein